MTVQKQITAEGEITREQSLILVRNLIRTTVSCICYVRQIFNENCFQDRLISGMSVKTLIPSSSESKVYYYFICC
jgi:hypothetical protein